MCVWKCINRQYLCYSLAHCLCANVCVSPPLPSSLSLHGEDAEPSMASKFSSPFNRWRQNPGAMTLHTDGTVAISPPLEKEDEKKRKAKTNKKYSSKCSVWFNPTFREMRMRVKNRRRGGEGKEESGDRRGEMEGRRCKYRAERELRDGDRCWGSFRRRWTVQRLKGKKKRHTSADTSRNQRKFKKIKNKFIFKNEKARSLGLQTNLDELRWNGERYSEIFCNKTSTQMCQRQKE